MSRIRLHIIVGIVAMMLCVQSAQAYTPVFSVGLRGGTQTVLPQIKSGDTWSVSNAYTGGGVVDFRYAYYSTLAPACLWGFYVGVGAGISSESLKGTLTDRYTNWDYYDEPLHYTVQSDFRQTTIYARAELSLMLAFYFGPVSLNFGPRFVVPFATKATMKLSDVSISAYFPQYGVKITDERITGLLDVPHKQKVKADRPYGILLMGAELGYEWPLTDKFFMGVQAYADISVLHVGSPLEPSSSPMIEVAPIMDRRKPIPEVTVHSITNYVGALRNLEFGVRIYYAFSVQLMDERRRRFR